jgi:hypothetical protein
MLGAAGTHLGAVIEPCRLSGHDRAARRPLMIQRAVEEELGTGPVPILDPRDRAGRPQQQPRYGCGRRAFAGSPRHGDRLSSPTRPSAARSGRCAVPWREGGAPRVRVQSGRPGSRACGGAALGATRAPHGPAAAAQRSPRQHPLPAPGAPQEPGAEAHHRRRRRARVPPHTDSRSLATGAPHRPTRRQAHAASTHLGQRCLQNAQRLSTLQTPAHRSARGGARAVHTVFAEALAHAQTVSQAAGPRTRSRRCGSNAASLSDDREAQRMGSGAPSSGVGGDQRDGVRAER